MKAEHVIDAIARQVMRRDIRRLFEPEGRPTPIHQLTEDEGYLIDSCEIVLKNPEAGDGHIDRPATAFQPRRLMTAPAADGCKRLLGAVDMLA